MIGSIRRHSTITTKQVLKRKNFLPTLIFTIFLWAIVGLLVYFVEPDTFLVIPGFFVFTFMALLFTFSMVFANTRRGLITSSGLTLFLLLRYLGIGNIINLLIISGLVVTVELYFSRR